MFVQIFIKVHTASFLARSSSAFLRSSVIIRCESLNSKQED